MLSMLVLFWGDSVNGGQHDRARVFHNVSAFKLSTLNACFVRSCALVVDVPLCDMGLPSRRQAMIGPACISGVAHVSRRRTVICPVHKEHRTEVYTSTSSTPGSSGKSYTCMGTTSRITGVK